MEKIPHEKAFYKFMGENGPIGSRSQNNYISWLKYVSDHNICELEELTDDGRIEKIFNELQSTKSTRLEYTTQESISNIRSALRKYLAFIYETNCQSNVIADICEITESRSTTKTSEIETRLGQGKYRKELIALWNMCAVTKVENSELLIASHIKPWRLSNNEERIDKFNGLLLSPNLDKLFDIGYISFSNNGEIIISSALTKQEASSLGVHDSMKLYKVEQGCLPYLEFHRKHILKG